MKILLDNCVPRPLRYLSDHEVDTAHERGWAALGNGVLLREAAAAGFDLFLTVDQNLQYQQNLAMLPLPVIVLVSPSLDVDALSLCMPHIQEGIARMSAGSPGNRQVLSRVSRDAIVP